MEADRYSMACNAPAPAPTPAASEEEAGLRRGQWTVEEDVVLVKYIESHGEGRWDSLAAASGLRRTGKSCRLRWMNYLRPDVRRGNITPEEQLLILELHSKFGNRWSKIAQHLPGRTDNEIKNYWRTRVLKHAKHLQCDVSSKEFKDAMQYLWMPRLAEKIRAATGSRPSLPAPASGQKPGQSPESSSSSGVGRLLFPSPPESDSTAADCCLVAGGHIAGGDRIQEAEFGSVQSPGGNCNQGSLDFEQWEMGDNLWDFEDIWS